jgi:Zn finger protein HypA/HybF involved in hydrogenase expression
MHEASVAQSILRISPVRSLASTAHTDTVTAIHVIIGQFRNIDIDSLKFAFDNIRPMYAGCSSCQC